MADLFKKKTDKIDDRATGLWSNKHYASAKDKYAKGIKSAYERNTIKKITVVYDWEEYLTIMSGIEHLRKLDNLTTSEVLAKLVLDEIERRNITIELSKELLSGDNEEELDEDEDDDLSSEVRK